MARNILKIEINKRGKKARIFDINGNIDTVEFNHSPSGYVLFKSFVCSDMLNIKGFDYYEHLNDYQKNILENLEEIKINLNNDFKSYDFVSDAGCFNLPVINLKYNSID